MKLNGWKGDPIDVVRMADGKLTTIDNTRVLAASRAGVKVEAVFMMLLKHYHQIL